MLSNAELSTLTDDLGKAYSLAMGQIRDMTSVQYLPPFISDLPLISSMKQAALSQHTHILCTDISRTGLDWTTENHHKPHTN